MPSTFRILGKIILVVGSVFAVIWALANLVEPTPREMSTSLTVPNAPVTTPEPAPR